MRSPLSPPRLPLPPSSSSPRRTPALGARSASRRASQWPEPGTGAPTPRAWVTPVSRIANLLLVPTAILYAVFFHDFGDHEHVFTTPRRWLAAQKAAFFSLTPEERKLAGLDGATAAKSEPPSSSPPQQPGTPR